MINEWVPVEIGEFLNGMFESLESVGWTPTDCFRAAQENANEMIAASEGPLEGTALAMQKVMDAAVFVEFASDKLGLLNKSISWALSDDEARQAGEIMKDRITERFAAMVLAMFTLLVGNVQPPREFGS